MPTLTLCTRCGRVDLQGALAGHCETCAPPPEVLDAHWRDVDARHREAVRDAAGGSIVLPQCSRTSPPTERVRRVAFWRVVSDRSLPHLFAPGPDVVRSLCRTAVDRGRSHTPEEGLRGCRRCALEAGWIGSLSDPVTT